jgi:hypothetical protein
MGSEDPARRQQIDAEAVGIDAQPANCSPRCYGARKRWCCTASGSLFAVVNWQPDCAVLEWRVHATRLLFDSRLACCAHSNNQSRSHIGV